VLEVEFFHEKSPEIMHWWASSLQPWTQNSQARIEILPRLNCEEDGWLSEVRRLERIHETDDNEAFFLKALWTHI
jgi:hypothetical protein